jgi:hypothetical protein
VGGQADPSSTLGDSQRMKVNIRTLMNEIIEPMNKILFQAVYASE